jgi:hypothetical protein
MDSNFEFLKGTPYYKRLNTAEEFVPVDSSSTGTLLRKVLEAFLYEVYKLKEIEYPKEIDYKKKPRPYSGKSLMNGNGFKKACPDYVREILWKCYNLGNDASHSGEYIEEIEISIDDASLMLEWTQQYWVWFLREMGHPAIDNIVFDKSLIPTKSKAQLSKEEYSKLLISKEEVTLQLNNEIEQVKKDNDELLSENASLKQSNENLEALLAKSEIKYESAGLTEFIDLVWGRVYTNFKYRNKNYFAVKYFKKENGATPKSHIAEGRFETSWLYTYFKRQHPKLAIPLVEEKEYDNYELLDKDSVYYRHKKTFGTPSILIKELKVDIENKMRLRTEYLASLLGQDELNKKFDYFGAYYKVNGINYRDQLIITAKEVDVDAPADLLVVMINPGASKGIDTTDYDENSFLDENKNEFIECIPDDTQYQISRLMLNQKWNKAIVINLFDICNVNSNDVVSRYTYKINDEIKILVDHLQESIFMDERRGELDDILGQLTIEAPILLGWGTRNELLKVKRSIYNNVLEKTARKIIGDKKEGFQYYHPWPRDDEDKRLNWVSEISEQINNVAK